jgi:hypothetical protein
VDPGSASRNLIPSSQATARAKAAQGTAEAQRALCEANAEFALLLRLNEQAELNQLVGSATGSTVHGGIFLYTIEGT